MPKINGIHIIGTTKPATALPNPVANDAGGIGTRLSNQYNNGSPYSGAWGGQGGGDGGDGDGGGGNGGSGEGDSGDGAGGGTDNDTKGNSPAGDQPPVEPDPGATNSGIADSEEPNYVVLNEEEQAEGDDQEDEDDDDGEDDEGDEVQESNVFILTLTVSSSGPANQGSAQSGMTMNIAATDSGEYQGDLEDGSSVYTFAEDDGGTSVMIVSPEGDVATIPWQGDDTSPIFGDTSAPAASITDLINQLVFLQTLFGNGTPSASTATQSPPATASPSQSASPTGSTDWPDSTATPTTAQTDSPPIPTPTWNPSDDDCVRTGNCTP